MHDPKPHYLDATKIDKVIVNLLSNAIKFTPKGGKITVRVWDDPSPATDTEAASPLSRMRERGPEPTEAVMGEGALKIQVSDTGIGIPQDKLAQVFERFMQVDASSTRAYAGMGIGLSLVKDFVEQHGGTVEVESEEGRGTRFTITLPRGREHFKAQVIEAGEAGDDDIGKGIELRQAPLVEMMATDYAQDLKEEEEENPLPRRERGDAIAETVKGEGARETVLVVDDTPGMRRAVRDVLKDYYRVITAQDGEIGVRMARERLPDLIISDIMMPHKDGFGLLQDLKGDPDPKVREIPVILLTAKSGEENLAQGFRFGADDYVAKPFQPKEVLSRVQNLLRIRRQKEEIEKQRDELGRVNVALKEAEAELVQTEKLSTIGLLAAGFAHEINNPAYALTLSLGNIENLLQEMKGGVQKGDALEKFDHHLKRSSQEIERIKKTVRTFLTYSQKNREGVRRQDVSQDIESTLALLQYTIDQEGAVVHWNRNGHAFTIEADHGALNQVFTNLIQNSLQAGARHINIDTALVGSKCVVKIADDGCGIAPDALPKIFEPFFTTKEVGKGTGLGLNISQRIVRTHGGDISVESTVGKGTEFTIVLPLTQV